MKVEVPDRASPVRVLVGMRVHMPAAVPVRVTVRGISVVVVNAPIRVGSISVILMPAVYVIAMAVVHMIRVGHIPVVLVRGVLLLVVVVAMLHVPEVLVLWFIVRGIEMARAGLVRMIAVAGCIGVVRVERHILVVGMPVVDVIGE